MMFLMRILEAVLGAGVIVAGLSVWRLCWPSSSRSWRAAAWVVAACAVLGVTGLYWAAALKVSVRTALAGDALVHAASPVLQAAIVSGIIVLVGGWILSFIRLGIPRFRAGSISNLKYEAVSLTVCVALLITSLELPVQDRHRLTPEQRISQLDRSLRALADGDREMPRDTWDPDYVVNIVGRDPQRLFAWVRDNTYWIPYHGVLRGPVGVLMDRQGNSLDRAILLATLLEKAGQTVRLAQGELTHEQAVHLLPGLIVDREVAFPPQQPPVKTGPGIQQVASQYNLDRSAVTETLQSQEQMLSHFSTELQARVADQSDRLLRAIDRPKAAEIWVRTLDAALTSLTDHWWVQLRDGSNWVDFDLLSDTGSALVSAAQTIAVKDLPEQTFHEITVRVIAEQWANGRLSEYRALERPLRPSDRIGQPIILQFWPTEWIADAKPGQPPREWKTDVLAQKEWDAVLAVGSNVLSTTSIPDTGDDPYAPKGGAFGGLASAFSESMNVPSQSENKTLSAVFLEYEIRVPGEKPRTIRRTIFDLLGPAARATPSPRLALDETKRLTRSLALAMQTEILPITCSLSREFATHLLAQNLLSNRDMFEFLLQGRLPAGAKSINELFDRSSPPLSSLYSLALARMKWGKPEEVFLDRPNLLTRHIYSLPSGKGIVMRDATDIVANEVGVSLSARDVFAARLEQGVLDTNAESLVRAAVTFGNAGDAFSASDAWKAYRPNHDTSLAMLKLSDDVRQQIATNLSAGYAVVAPESAIPMPREPFAGWWRIDPITGDALGFGANGWGTEMEEESPQYTRTANTAPRWLVAMKTFAMVFPVAFAGAYGWCVTPLIVKHMGELPDALAETAVRNPDTLNNPVATAAKTVLHHSLGIWEGAIKPSVEHCVGDSIVIGGITALFAVVAVVGDVPTPKGQSEPFESPNGNGGKGGKPSSVNGPNEPGAGPQNGGNPPNPKPPSNDPCPDGEGASPNANSVNNESPGGPPEEPSTGVPEVPTAADVEAARQAALAAKQQYKSAYQVSSEAVGEYVRYTLRIQNRVGPAPNENGDYWPPGPPVAKKWPNEPGPQDYDPEFADGLLKKANETSAQSWAALRRFEDFYDRYAAIDKKYLETRRESPPQPGGAAGNCGTPYLQPGQTLGLGPGNTRPLGPAGPPSPIGPPIGPPLGSSPPGGASPAGPGQTQPLSPGGPPPGTGPPGSQGGPPPGTQPPGLGYTQPVSTGGPPPGTAPPGAVDPYAKTAAGLSGVGSAIGKP